MSYPESSHINPEWAKTIELRATIDERYNQAQLAGPQYVTEFENVAARPRTMEAIGVSNSSVKISIYRNQIVSDLPVIGGSNIPILLHVDSPEGMPHPGLSEVESPTDLSVADFTIGMAWRANRRSPWGLSLLVSPPSSVDGNPVIAMPAGLSSYGWIDRNLRDGTLVEAAEIEKPILGINLAWFLAG